jgi:uncharacterized protein with HEPN domain
MLRDYKVYLEDILEASRKIRDYSSGLTFADFAKDPKTLDAVVRNLEVIGEATKKIPESIRTRHTAIDWKKIAGLRDILIHEYFGVDVEVIWDILQNKLPVVEKQIQDILHEQT